MLKEGNVTVMVSDMKRAIRFYSETLGLKLRVVYGDEWAEVGMPGLVIGLHPATHNSSENKGNLSIGFTVENLGAVMKGFHERGVQFEPNVVDEEAVRLVFFSDPDQTPLHLCQVKG